ncbi:MAG: hypothetical protein JNK35_11740 [Phycisphaerae bacterium]|nr:hypothetical protein [Phycisphaerae bacterium]
MPERTWPDIPGQFVTPVEAGAVRVEIVPRGARTGTDEGLDEGDHAHWAGLCASNPRYHDGDILSVARIAADGGGIECVPDRFKRLAVQRDDRDLGVRLLGVKGMIVGRDQGGGEHVLIARRGPQTRVYHDQWEIAPAGGIDGVVDRSALARAAAGGRVDLGTRVVIDALAEEGREELGLEIDPAWCRPVCIVRDEVARSVDVIVRVDWPKPIDPRRAVCGGGAGGGGGLCAGGNGWEYTDSAWLARADAPGFEARAAESLVGPMRAALRWAGWTTGSE